MERQTGRTDADQLPAARAGSPAACAPVGHWVEEGPPLGPSPRLSLSLNLSSTGSPLPGTPTSSAPTVALILSSVPRQCPIWHPSGSRLAAGPVVNRPPGIVACQW